MADSGPQASFDDIFKGITDAPGLYSSLKDSQLKKEFMRQIRTIYGWADVYVQLFPRIMDATIIEELEKENDEKLTAMTAECFERYRERREAAVWLFRMYVEAKAKAALGADGEMEQRARAKAASRVEWYEAAGVSQERQIIVMIHLLDITHRDIENQRETTEARKINKQVYNALFRDGVLARFIDGAERDTATRIYSFVSDLKSLEPQDKIALRSRIQDRFPDFKFSENIEKRVSQGLTVTKGKYEEKQRQLVHIMDVEIPANSREIEDARQHGDLKENAEYIAAREKQTQLNTATEKLKEEIDRAQIFDPAMIDNSRVSFGTVAVLKNESTGGTEKYTILGPWESNPENHVISYQTPFGKAMINKVAGDRFQFASDSDKVTYLVERIDAAAF